MVCRPPDRMKLRHKHSEGNKQTIVRKTVQLNEESSQGSDQRISEGQHRRNADVLWFSLKPKSYKMISNNVEKRIHKSVIRYDRTYGRRCVEWTCRIFRTRKVKTEPITDICAYGAYDQPEDTWSNDAVYSMRRSGLPGQRRSVWQMGVPHRNRCALWHWTYRTPCAEQLSETQLQFSKKRSAWWIQRWPFSDADFTTGVLPW